MAESVGDNEPPRRRRRTATWIALAIGVALVGLVVALAKSEPATTRAADSPLLGKPAPYLEGRTLDGESIALTDNLGKWVLVNFFATWCVPCRQEHPQLIQWQQRHAMIGDATIVGVIFDDDVDAVRRFRAEEGGDWPMLLDPDGQIAVDFGVAGVPESYLISPDGVIVSKIVGGILDGELEALLDRARARTR